MTKQQQVPKKQWSELTREEKTKGIVALVAILFGLFVLFNFIISGNATEKASEATPKRCINVPANTIASIQSTLETGLTLRNAKAVKSNDYKNVYFISADLEGLGFEKEDDYVTFSTNGINNEGMFYSISYVASEFSVLPSGSTTDAKMTMSSDGAKESENCLSQ